MEQPPDRTPNALRIARTLIESLSAHFRRLPAGAFVAVVLGIAGARWGAGIGPLGPLFYEHFHKSAGLFPLPHGWMDSSLGVVFVMKLFGYPSLRMWTALGFAGMLAMFAFVVHLAWRAGNWWREALLLVLLSPAFGVLTHLPGHYDYFTVIGTTIAATGRRWTSMALGSAIAVLGNPEQVLASALCLGLVGVAYARLRARAAILAGAALTMLTLLRLLYGHHSGRYQALVEPWFYEKGIYRFFADWPLVLWAFLGPLWLVLLVLIARLSRLRALAVTTGVVIIPGLFAAVTIDGTRVFTAVSCAALVGLIRESWRGGWSVGAPPTGLLGVLLLALFLTPGLQVFSGDAGALIRPYVYLLGVLNLTP